MQVDGVSIHYKEVMASSDASESPPLTLLLLHGFNGSVFNWRKVMQQLASEVSAVHGSCRVVAFDRPPFGLSERPLEWPSEEQNPYTQSAG